MRQHSGKKRLGAVLLSLALCLSLLPGTALAADTAVEYIEYSWKEETQTLSSDTKEISEYTTINENMTTWNADTTGGWYVATDNVTISSRVTVTGDVHLILQDDCTLTVNGGIQVADNDNDPQTPSPNSLTIYGQAKGTGELIADVNIGHAGIGGNRDPNGGNQGSAGGTVTIHGGKVIAAGGNSGAGIGGGSGGAGGTVKIYGGTVEATGNGNGAGIGGGGSGGAGGEITISGGNVTASSSGNGAGIGGGGSGSGGAGGNITITGGTNAAGIGGGGRNNGQSGAAGTFSTGDAGNAVIFASSIQDEEDESNPWRGVIFKEDSGQVYGTSITPTEDFTIGKNQTLTIDNGKTLVIQEGVTLTNEGTIINNGMIINYGTIINTGTIINKNEGAITNTNTGTITNEKEITNDGAITNEGTINNKDTITNNGTIDVNGGGTLTGNEVSGTGEVNYEVTGVSLNKFTTTLTVGDSETLTATVTPEDAKDTPVTWASSNESVATVDANGTVTAMGAGTATITATADGKTATCTVTVERPYVPPANPNYRIDVTTTAGGTVDKDPAAAKAGETVTLTPAPDAGYEVGEIIVTDRFGDAVEVTENPNGTYTFTMPNGQVSVEVTFVEVQPEPLPFTDVAEGDWFHDAVQYAYENGLMDGVGDGQFAPNATTNRAMVVTILYRLAGEPAVSGDVAFTDVAPGQWYSNAVAWAAQKGSVNGISETEFAPAGDLTREQLATILYRYAESASYDVSAQADLSGFPDVGDIQDYATEALSWAVAEGLLQGFEDDSLQPQSTATRAQIATILMRFCEGVAE